MLQNLQYLSNNIQIEKVQKDTTNKQPLKQNNYCGDYYKRHQAIHFIKNLFPIDNFDYSQINQVISKYFVYNINPIYQKILKLPMKFFFCGYCKEPFKAPSQYLKHCFLEKCPLNQNRSTFFFYFKNTLSLIKNSDLKKTFTQQQISLLLISSYGKKNILFSNYKLDIFEEKQIFKCNYCEHKIMKKFPMSFIKHCIFKCPNSLSQQQRVLNVQYFEQNSVKFVNDIINFHLNYNILTLFQDSYLRVIKNPKYENQSSPYICLSCKLKFTSEQFFLLHVIFQCSFKQNQASSHFIKRKLIPCIASQEKITQSIQQIIKKNQRNKNSQEKITQSSQQIIKKNQRNKNSQEKIIQSSQQIIKKIQRNKDQNKIRQRQIFNKKYENFKDLFQNIYFCGYCLNHFQNSEDYLLHCVIYLCPLNYERNSHYYFESNLQPLDIQIVKKEISPEIISKFRKQYKLKNFINYDLLNKKTNQLQEFSNYFICGKCSNKFIQKKKFISHIIKHCISYENQKTSHKLLVTEVKMSYKNFQHFLKSLLFSIKIMKQYNQKQFILSQNKKIQHQLNYFCCKCQTDFQNLFEYVYHSISVCESLKCKNCSHEIVQSVRKIIEHPLRIVCFKLNNLFVRIKVDSFIKKLSNNQQQNDFQQQDQIMQNEKYTHQKIEIQQNQINQNINQNQNTKTKQINQRIAYTQIDEIQNILIKQKSQQTIVSQVKFLRANIEFMAQNKIKFYCGNCKLSFKNQQSFISHLQICKQFQNNFSSHFFITNNRFREIESQKTFSHKLLLLKAQFPQEFSPFRISKNDKFQCLCGTSGCITTFLFHQRKHFQQNQSNSHVILRMVPFDRPGFISYNTVLSISLKPSQFQINDFICPCKPWKKHSYESFVKHIGKRHFGNSPKFHMRLPKEYYDIKKSQVEQI